MEASTTGHSLSVQRATPGPMTELPDLHKQQASMAHCLPEAAGLSARTFKGSHLPPQHTAPDRLPSPLRGSQGQIPPTTHQSRLPSPGRPPQPPGIMAGLVPSLPSAQQSQGSPPSSFSLALPPTLSQKPPSGAAMTNPLSLAGTESICNNRYDSSTHNTPLHRNQESLP